MSGRTTRPYRSTLSGSIGAGMSSVFNPSGRKYYILEHKVSSRYHRAGEAQEIIVDQIEIGRDSRCQVRFDDYFSTVSRHHAAIVRDGENWKLVQISKTNTTLLNGRPVQTEWYLQNGDEIQLSVNGPKLGFIVPTGKKATVGSIGLTRRLSLFRQQALRPYKQAIAVLSTVLVLAVGGLTTWNILMKKDFDKQLANAQERLHEMIDRNAELKLLVDSTKHEQERQDSLIEALKKQRAKVVYRNYGGSGKNGGGGHNASLSSHDQIDNDVFFIYTNKIVVTDGEREIVLKTYNSKGELTNYSWIASGFLLDDGRFVTAKHCVEGWKFFNSPKHFIAEAPQDSTSLMAYLMAQNVEGWKIVAYLTAVSPTKKLTFKSSDFVMSRASEKKVEIVDGVYAVHSSLNDGSDWAYTHTSQKGCIHADANLSANLHAGVELDIRGFPHGFGALDTDQLSCLHGSCKTARQGLDGGVIKITGRNYEGGNSGGPALYKENNSFKAVGIVSYEVSSTMGGLVPLYNLK